MRRRDLSCVKKYELERKEVYGRDHYGQRGSLCRERSESISPLGDWKKAKLTEVGEREQVGGSEEGEINKGGKCQALEVLKTMKSNWKGFTQLEWGPGREMKVLDIISLAFSDVLPGWCVECLGGRWVESRHKGPGRKWLGLPGKMVVYQELDGSSREEDKRMMNLELFRR